MTRRPPPIWIALGILTVYLPLLTYGILVPYDRSVLDESDIIGETVFYAEAVGIIGSFVGAAAAIWKRKRWGRWLLVCPVVYLVGSIGFMEAFYPDPSAVPDDRYSLWLGMGTAFAPPLFTFLLVSFGDTAREYFSQSES